MTETEQIEKTGSATELQIYPLGLLQRLKHDYNPRDVPNELRNFKFLLTKCPQLHKQLQLIKEVDGIYKLNDDLIDPCTATIRKLTSILNKLTDANYESMLNQVKSFKNMTDESIVATVINVLIHNIKLSNSFIKLYACLTRDVDRFKMWDQMGKPFSVVLSQRCQQYFDEFQQPMSRDNLKEFLSGLADSDDKNDTEARIKRENKAIVLFLGHLYLNNLLDATDAVQIADRLLLPLSGRDKLDDFNIDYFLAFYPVVKPKMVSSRIGDSVRAFDDRLLALRDQALSFRLKFMVEDFIKQNRIRQIQH